MTEPQFTEAEKATWARLAATASPVTLTSSEIDALLGIIFALHSSIYSLQSAAFRASMGDAAGSKELAGTSLNTTNDSFEATKKLHRILLQRLSGGASR